MRCLGNNIERTINNIRVAYSDEGPVDAPVIIFIHGFPFNRCMWDKQAEALSEHYRVITYDVRGHGKTDAGYNDFSMDVFSADLIALMDALEIETAVLCGLSMGGYIALNAMEKYPHSFDALVLCDTQCIDDTLEVKEKRMKAIESIRKNGVEQYADESIKNLFAPASDATKQNEIAAIREMIVNTSRDSLRKTMIALAERKTTCRKLQEISIPVLIMVGSEDKITPLTESQKMHKNIPGSVLCVIENAGHVSNMENPDMFNEQLMKFMRQHAEKPIRMSARQLSVSQ